MFKTIAEQIMQFAYQAMQTIATRRQSVSDSPPHRRSIRPGVSASGGGIISKNYRITICKKFYYICGVSIKVN